MIPVVVIQFQSQQFWIWAGVILLDCGLDSRGILLQYLERGRHFSFLQNISFGAHQASYSVGTKGFSLGWGEGGSGCPIAVSSTKVEHEWSHITSISTYSFVACRRRALLLSLLNLSQNGEEWFWMLWLLLVAGQCLVPGGE